MSPARVPWRAYSRGMPPARRYAVLTALAVLVTGALAFAATSVERAGIEADLTTRARDALSASNLPGEVSFTGRDATVRTGTPREALLARAVVRGLDGVRSVTVVSAPGRAEGGPDGTPDAVTDPDTVAKARLQRAVDDVLADDPIEFRPYSADPSPDGLDTVSAVAALLADAPSDWRFEVGGHVARVPGAEPESAGELSEARAEVVAEELVDLGVSPEQVNPVGYGDTRPLSDRGTSAADRRVEITVR